jgi:hypothetical protein
VLGIDFVLERETPSAGQLASGDVFPFGEPDGNIDVRDLTVLTRALILGVWPDGAVLPEEGPGELQTGKDAYAGASVVVEAVEQAGVVGLALDLSTPLRAVQISLTMENPDALPVLQALALINLGVHIESHYDAQAGAFRLLAVRMDGGLIEPGRYALASVETAEPAMTLAQGIAIDAGRKRTPVHFRTIAATDSEREEPVRTASRLGLPFPNPYSMRNTDALTLPLRLGAAHRVDLEVFDILGRSVHRQDDRRLEAGDHRLTWNGRDPLGRSVAPGLYMIRVGAGELVETRLVVIE